MVTMVMCTLGNALVYQGKQQVDTINVSMHMHFVGWVRHAIHCENHELELSKISNPMA